jgi:hypothetical protein
VSDRAPSILESTPGDIQKLLKQLNIVPGDEDGRYRTNVERAKLINTSLEEIDRLKKEIEEARQGLVDDSDLSLRSKLWSPAGYRVDKQKGKWESDLEIKGLNSKISSLKELAETQEMFLRKAWTEGHKVLIEGQKVTIWFNDKLAGLLVNPGAKVTLALTIALVGSIPSWVIANRPLWSTGVSNGIATGVESLLLDKFRYPSNLVFNGVQWTGWNTGFYEVQLATEHKNETTGQDHNFTTDAFASLLADPFVNTTIKNMLLGRLDELTESGPITIN